VALNGSLDTTRPGTASVDVRPVSASTRTVSVTNASDSGVTLELPTRFEASVWRDLLADQMAPDGYVESVNVVSGSPTNTLVVELTPGENYTLRLAKAGVGTGVTETDPAYLTDVAADGTTVPEEGTETLVVEVRDAYNNPVSGVNVAGEAPLGTLVEGNVTTDEDGRATFRYEAPSVGSETTDDVEFSYPDRSGTFSADDPENVQVSVVVQNTKGAAGAGGTGGAPYTVTWNSPPDDRGVDVGSEGDTLDMQAVVEDLSIDTSRNRTVEGARVDFAVNNSTVASLSPSQDVSDGDCEVTTTLTAENNGTVRVYAVSGGASDVVNVTFENLSSAPSVSAVSLSGDGSGNLAFSFDTDEQLGSDPGDIGVSVDGPDSGATVTGPTLRPLTTRLTPTVTTAARTGPAAGSRTATTTRAGRPTPDSPTRTSTRTGDTRRERTSRSRSPTSRAGTPPPTGTGWSCPTARVPSTSAASRSTGKPTGSPSLSTCSPTGSR
ncbi:hypothetical protein BRC60_05550, partial [Halobacteriales archaeon QH_1_68_42]